jgi:hypothetical protein
MKLEIYAAQRFEAYFLKGKKKVLSEPLNLKAF